jgi:hypothetical protein
MTVLCNSPAPTPAEGSDPASGTRRRRLWQLPTQAHELLLAMSFAPEVLRREAERVLGRMRHGICVLRGCDADVLYSVVHDMAKRNPLSEAFQKRLDGAHAPTIRRFAGMRGAGALQDAWRAALDAEHMPGALWALLTHPLGADLETRALYDARAWVFAHGRRSVALLQAHQQADDRLHAAQQQLAALRARLLAQQQQAEEALRQARAEAARLSGELARRQQIACADPAARQTPLQAPDIGEPVTEVQDQATGPKAEVSRPAVPALPFGSPNATRQHTAPPPHTALSVPASPVTVHGRRVLCVGGIQHAVARYRGRIEKLGGQFEHHDGGIEDSVQALEGRLSRADLVICQAACINHDAYHRIKRHCERTGTPCMYLDRPSLSRLDRALAQTAAPAAWQAPATGCPG